MRSNIAPARLDVGYVFNAGALPVKSSIGYALNLGGQKDTNSSTGCRAAFTSLQGDDRG